MIDLEKLRKLSVLYEVDNQPMKIDVDLFRELLDHIAQLEKYESRLITERDHRDDVIDRMADAVLGSDRHEWTSAYDIDDAAEEVEQRIAQLEKDAARYRWLREGNDAKHGAAWHVAVNLYGCEWDAAIDAAIKKGATQ